MKLMNGIKKLLFFLLLVLSVYVFILIYPYLKDIVKFILKLILPFLIAFTIAYILQPLVCFFQKRIKKRSIAVFLVLGIFIVLLMLSLYLIIPHMNRELKALIENFPGIIADIEKAINDFANHFDFLPIDYRPTLANISKYFSEYITRIANLPEQIIDKFLSYISIIVVIPTALVYFLLDYEKIICSIRDYLIAKNKLRLKEYLGDLNQKISSYIRGTFIIMLILSVLSTLGFLIIGLEYPLFFGIIIAITDIIPYIGPYVGALLPVGFALLISPQMALTVIIVIVIVQLLESNLITPYIQSKQTQTHPLLVILFLLLFGSLFGIFGMILALPLLTIIKTTFKHYPPKFYIKEDVDGKFNNNIS